MICVRQIQTARLYNETGKESLLSNTRCLLMYKAVSGGLKIRSLVGRYRQQDLFRNAQDIAKFNAKERRTSFKAIFTIHMA